MKGILALLVVCAVLNSALSQDALGHIAGRSFLVVTSDMRDTYVPGNIRAADLAKTLRSDGGSVVFITKNGDFAPEFRRSLEAAGVELVAPTVDEGVFTDTLIQERQFDAAFLYLWFWGNDLSAPQMYIPTIRHHSPQTKVVVITDDAHTERLSRLNSANARLSDPVQMYDVQHNEFDVYAKADAVVTVSESDEATLKAAFSQFNTPVSTLHWGHALNNLALPTVDEVPSFGSRSGLVFVGFGRNPSNKIGLNWFLEKVWPQLSSAMKEETIYIVGSAFNRPETSAKIEIVNRKDHRALRSLMNTARAMIAPSFATGLTTKILLGLSSGLPVVATEQAAAGYRWQGQEEVFADSMMVASSASDFASKLDLLASDPTTWARFSAGGLALADAQLKSQKFDQDVRTLLGGLALKPSANAKSVATFFTPQELRSHELSRKSANHLDFSSRSAQFDVMSGTGVQIWQPNCSFIYATELIVNIAVNPSVGLIINGTASGCGCGATPNLPYPGSTLSSVLQCDPTKTNTSAPPCFIAGNAAVQEVMACYCQWAVELAVANPNPLEQQMVGIASALLGELSETLPTCCGSVPCAPGQSSSSTAPSGGESSSSTGGPCVSGSGDGYNFCGAAALQVNHVVLALAIVAAFFTRRA